MELELQLKAEKENKFRVPRRVSSFVRLGEMIFASFTVHS